MIALVVRQVPREDNHVAVNFVHNADLARHQVNSAEPSATHSLSFVRHFVT